MDVNSTEDNMVVIAEKLSEPSTNMSKRQLKRLLRDKKWLERRGEKRLGIPDHAAAMYENFVNCDNFVASFYLKTPRINLLIYNVRTYPIFTFYLC